MRTTLPLLSSLLVLTGASPLFAKARTFDKEELLARAPLIAIVEVEAIAPAKLKGAHWTYQQAAKATLVRSLRGDLPKAFTIHAQKDFECASASYAEGRWLVFLRREGELFTTMNHERGQFQLQGEALRFFSDAARPLKDVLAEVSAPKAYFAEQWTSEERLYSLESVCEVTFPGRERVLGKTRLFRGAYTSPIPSAPGSNVRGRYNHQRLLLVDAEGVQRPLDAITIEWLSGRFLAPKVTAKDAKERTWVAAAFMHLVQGGDQPFGAWWGSRATREQEVSKGHVVHARWTHGKSLSWTDELAFRFEGERLVAIDHEVRQH